jgi:hypothetical protein
LVNDISNLSKENLHSFYTSKDDSGDLVVYADAEQHDIDKFIWDTAIVKGVNIPELDLLYRDDANNNWSKEQTIDLTEIEIDKQRITSVQEFTIDNQRKILIKIDEADFDANRFFEFDYYLYDGDSNIGKIVENRGNELVLNVNESWTISNFGAKIKIYPDSKVISLDDGTQNKQIGVRFNDGYNTYEGQYRINFLDFGMSTVIPLEWNHEIGTGSEYSVNTSSEYVYDTQSFSVDDTYFRKQFNLSWDVINEETLDKIKSLNQRVGFNRRPLYVIEDKDVEPHKVYVCFFDSELSSSVLKDFDNQKLYRASTTLRSIG